MGVILFFFLFIGIPVAVIIFFIMSLVEFKGTPKDHLYYKKRKTKFIVSAVFAGILATAVVALFIMSQMIIRYM